jgi:hypothetical protein
VQIYIYALRYTKIKAPIKGAMYRGFFFNWNLKVSISAVVAFLMSSRMDSHFLKDSTNYVQVLFPTDHSILFSCSFCWRVSHYGVVFEKLIVRWRESNFLFKSCFSWKIKFRKILDWLSFLCIKWDLNSICMEDIGSYSDFSIFLRILFNYC